MIIVQKQHAMAPNHTTIKKHTERNGQCHVTQTESKHQIARAQEVVLSKCVGDAETKGVAKWWVFGSIDLSAFSFLILEDRDRTTSKMLNVTELPRSIVIDNNMNILYSSDKPPKDL